MGRRRGNARGWWLQRARGGTSYGGRGHLPQPDRSGPHSSLIQAALEHVEITDLGPHIAGIDNGFCIAFTDRTGERTFISTKGAETMSPASAWADFVRTMHPGDVLYIDGYLMDHPANREAAEAALRVLPEGVRVLLDVSPVIGIPSALPSDGASCR